MAMSPRLAVILGPRCRSAFAAFRTLDYSHVDCILVPVSSELFNPHPTHRHDARGRRAGAGGVGGAVTRRTAIEQRSGRKSRGGKSGAVDVPAEHRSPRTGDGLLLSGSRLFTVSRLKE